MSPLSLEQLAEFIKFYRQPLTHFPRAMFTGSAELLNGFANRFLWCAAHRSQVLPFSECAQWYQHPQVLEKLAKVLETFKPGAQERKLARSDEANKLWKDHYGETNHDDDG